MEVINGEIMLRFMTPKRKTAELPLSHDGKYLTGPVTGTGQIGKTRTADDSLRLRKLE